jgi:glycosyltransferase involved in cell wall biosynthesis
VRQRFPGAGLVIAGAGSLEEELRHRIASLDWAEHVLLAGDVPHASTLRAIAEADVFLRTTLYDGDSVAVREALQLGTPVAASDNGMRPEGVRLIPARNHAALVSAIGESLAAGRKRPEAAEVGEDNVEAVLDVYAELMKR